MSRLNWFRGGRFGLRSSGCFRTSASCHRLFRPCASSLLLLSLAFGFCGCAGYRLGPSNGLAAGEKSVQVNPFPNRTLEPRLTNAVTQELRKAVQHDGTYQLATQGDGDIVVSGSITRYNRGEVTLASNDILLVRDYQLVLTAHVTAEERATGKVILDQNVSGYTMIRVGADLSSAERQALPVLAADLAKNITALLAEGKW